MKICTIIGARPQFIKAAVLSAAVARMQDVQEIIVHTGQHYDVNMSDIFFEQMNIPAPSYHLGIGGGTHGQNTGRMIEAVEDVLLRETPDILLVYGDTDSTLAGALAAVKISVPVAHVEAGLRSYNRAMPEEINRVLTDHISDFLFCPTKAAMENLKEEGISSNKVHMVGDVMYDVALAYVKKAKEESIILKRLALGKSAYVLATLHRAENTNDRARLQSIMDGLAQSPCPVILPMHPRTKKIIADEGIIVPDIIQVIDPVGYLDMAWLEKNARLIATDSGGMQKEAYFHGVPCLTLRDETEWVELVKGAPIF